MGATTPSKSCDCPSGLHGGSGTPATAQSVSAILRASIFVSYSLLATVYLITTYEFRTATSPTYLAHRETPLTPASWAYSIWGLILTLQGAAAIDQALPVGYSDPWKVHIVSTIAMTWQLGWAFEMGNYLSVFSHTSFGLWIGLASLTGAAVSFGWTLRRLYSLRSRLSLGPPSFFPAYCLYFASTDVNTAWLSFCLADGILIFCQACGWSKKAIPVLAIALLLAVWCASIWVVLRKRNTWYGLAVIWALVGIFSQQRTNAVMRSLCIALVFGAGLVTIFSVIRRRPRAERTKADPTDESHSLSAGDLIIAGGRITGPDDNVV